MNKNAEVRDVGFGPFLSLYMGDAIYFTPNSNQGLLLALRVVRRLTGVGHMQIKSFNPWAIPLVSSSIFYVSFGQLFCFLISVGFTIAHLHGSFTRFLQNCLDITAPNCWDKT